MSCWEPATVQYVEALVAEQLANCEPRHQQLFASKRCQSFVVPIRRYGATESVIAVARFGNQVLYFEDVEEGFALSQLDEDGCIPEPDYSQFELGHLLHQIAP